MTGSGPTCSINQGWKDVCRIGARMNKPQMPNTMLGTAASSSIPIPIGVRNQ